jgi:adiponectin receptor
LSGFLRTLFTLHNQTGNIWTHLLGFGYFAFVGFKLVVELTTVDAAVEETGGLQAFEPISVLLLVLASGFCLMASVFYHVCFCGDEHVYQCTYTMDLSGIVVLVGTSYFTGITLGYRCFPTTRQFYLVYAACVILALSVPLVKPGLIQNVARHMIMCVAAGMVPAVHFYWISSPQDAAVLVPYIVGMFFCYGVGAAFYVTKWPESRWPGRFDLFGHSHQIWHVFVFSAALIWVRGCDTFLRYSGGSHCAEELGVALTH